LGPGGQLKWGIFKDTEPELLEKRRKLNGPAGKNLQGPGSGGGKGGIESSEGGRERRSGKGMSMLRSRKLKSGDRMWENRHNRVSKLRKSL